MDFVKFDYLPIDGATNILVKLPKGQTNNEHHVDQFMAPLLLKLTKAQPNWVFASRRIPMSNSVRDFEVYENKELLGWVSKDENYGGNDVYAFQNHRLRKDRVSGREVRTKDIKRAFKEIVRNFGSKTPLELFSTAIADAELVVSATHSKNVMNREAELNYIKNGLRDYAFANWDAFMASPVLSGYSYSPERLALIPTILEEYGITATIRAASGITVMVHDSKYYMAKSISEGLHATEQSDLSEHTKRSIGMLKLVDNKKYLAGIGVRVTDTVFYILPEEEK